MTRRQGVTLVEAIAGVVSLTIRVDRVAQVDSATGEPQPLHHIP